MQNRRRTRRQSERGFTLVELLTVIAIIGVMASVVLVATVTFRNRAVASRVEQEVASFQKAAAIFLTDNSRYPDPSTASNVADACVGRNGDGVWQKCCISENGCSYQGVTLDTLAADGDFAAAERPPRWLALFGERAYAVLDGTLPRFLTEAPVSPSGFKGVFYDCGITCETAYVYFTVPQEDCSRGAAHNDIAGVCAQNVASFDEDGDYSDSLCGDGACDESESCADDCAGEAHCADGVDNDGDTSIDCGDSDCSSDPSCVVAESCWNNLDDDSDGYTDGCDSECSLGDNGYCYCYSSDSYPGC